MEKTPSHIGGGVFFSRYEKRDGKKEHEENELEKIFNLYKKLVEWIINEQLGYIWYVYCFINKIKTQDVVLSKKCVIKIT